jgi:adhesin transport system membrane fusion protein
MASVIVAGISALLFSLVSWAAIAHLEEVTRGSGRVITSSRIQVVQSSEPGVVQEIAVRLGQRVSRGDLLIRLDDTPNSAKAGEVDAQARALRAQIARLEVEAAGGQKDLTCPEEITAVAPEVCESERRLLEIRRENQQKRLDVFTQRIEQRQRELNETQASLTRFSEGLKLAEKELGILAPMASRNLVAQTELIRAQRQVVDLKGQIASAKEGAAKVGAALREADLQYEEQELQFQREATAELTTKRSEYSVLLETQRGATDRVRRTDIRSPVDGIVNAIPVTTLGAFVNAGDRVVEVVPVEDKLLVEAKVRPQDIAFITPGQRALVKVTAYDFFQYGGLNGVVEQISADSLYDPNQKEAFYSVIVRTEESHLTARGKTFPIIPGMVCDVDIITGEKSVLTYLLKPIHRARQEALRER